MLSQWIAAVLSNFDLAMFVFAALFIIIHRVANKASSEYEIVIRWLLLFAVGFTGIYAGVMHVFFPEISAHGIGWLPSPFQFEVGMANFSFGVLGILAFRAAYSFRLAVVIGATVWLWGDAIGHLYRQIEYNNYTVGNAGSWFWMDLLIPAILIVCIYKLKPQRFSK